MFARALIVLLLVLNVGVAAWWALRPAPQPAAIVQPDGVARLQLLSEATPQAGQRSPAPAPSADVSQGSGTAQLPAGLEAGLEATPDDVASAKTGDVARTPAPEADAATTPVVSMPVTAENSVCFSFGPFASADAAQLANARLLSLVRRAVVHTRTASPVRGWRVVVPALPTQEAAKAVAKRIADAGFSDYLLMHDGADANAIAMGRYGSEATARRRVQTLAAAGFATRAEPLGGGPSTTWLDVAAASGFDAAHAQSIAKAPGREALDCARLQ